MEREGAVEILRSGEKFAVMFVRYDLPGVLLNSYRTYPRESLIELLTRRLPIAQKVLADAMRQLEERGFASIAHVRLTDEERLDIGLTGLGDKFPASVDVWRLNAAV